MELPYTLPQDSTLFLYLGESNIDLWKEKLAWIAGLTGFVLLEKLNPFQGGGARLGGLVLIAAGLTLAAIAVVG